MQRVISPQTPYELDANHYESKCQFEQKISRDDVVGHGL
jgi:hypothetical protein